MTSAVSPSRHDYTGHGRARCKKSHLPNTKHTLQGGYFVFKDLFIPKKWKKTKTTKFSAEPPGT